MSDVLTDERLAEIDARAEAATPGPWTTYEWGWMGADEGGAGVCLDTEDLRAIARTIDAGTLGDAAFIAHARADVPALVAEVRRLRAKHDDWRGCPSPGEALAHNSRTGGGCFGAWLWREDEGSAAVTRMVAVRGDGSLDIDDDLPRNGQWRPVTMSGDSLPWPVPEAV